MKRGGELKRTRLKPGRRKPRPSLQAFHEAVTRDPCALGPAGCMGRLWGHHHYPKQRLRHDEAAYVDPRNGVSLCVAHHAAVEAGQTVCPRPSDLEGFLADYGLYERERAA